METCLGEIHAIVTPSLHPADVAGSNYFKPEDGERIFFTYKTAWHENVEDGNMNTPCCENPKTCVHYVIKKLPK
jgi:hypothetical protein